MFYQPDQLMYYPPEVTGFDYENIYFHSHDRYRLHAWFFPSKTRKPIGTIVQFHGNAQNLTSHYLSLSWVVDYGYNLFIYDYRGYGESLGEPTPETVNKDALVALDQALELSEKTGTKNLIAYGQSLGGAVLLRALADSKINEHISLLVLDSTFLSYKTVARQTLSRFVLTWPLSPLGYLLISDEFAPEKTLASVKLPLLIIHDKGDRVIRYSNGEEINQHYTGPKEFWNIDHGTHVGIFFVEKGKYRSEFIKKISTLSKKYN